MHINLSLEGPTFRLSRKQAYLTLTQNEKTKSAEVYITNTGKRALFIDKITLMTGEKTQIYNNSILIFGQIRLLFVLAPEPFSKISYVAVPTATVIRQEQHKQQLLQIQQQTTPQQHMPSSQPQLQTHVTHTHPTLTTQRSQQQFRQQQVLKVVPQVSTQHLQQIPEQQEPAYQQNQIYTQSQTVAPPQQMEHTILSQDLQPQQFVTVVQSEQQLHVVPQQEEQSSTLLSHQPPTPSCYQQSFSVSQQKQPSTSRQPLSTPPTPSSTSYQTLVLQQPNQPSSIRQPSSLSPGSTTSYQQPLSVPQQQQRPSKTRQSASIPGTPQALLPPTPPQPTHLPYPMTN